ncbi:hypothetical protein MUN84_22580 (plasmid) [Hymenobacter sp. 5516J-16]|uniref:hypothetical protein n=1 Tax=Hymenobacter sp. 5516J-16 TaxID=2932253 RepID=UPI001FD13400|nr:hypothetical protein [Hymenobacter sp. 5516J-16]UOQ79226.1 hypothetical protein MUN84_22580 [Hymenobacter sp. 5516J-16]
MRSLSTLLLAITSFQATEADDWLDLEDLLQELWEVGEPPEALVPLFQLLERFPKDESNGVLMGVLHGIETYPSYEQELVESLQRQPTDITLFLVRRIANTGQQAIAGQPIKLLYEQIGRHPNTPTRVQKLTQDWM